MKAFALLLISLLPLAAWAESPQVPESVEDAIRIMDKDHDGQVSVLEVRAYLEAKHGKGYEQALMDEWETRAGIRSCGSPFTRPQF